MSVAGVGNGSQRCQYKMVCPIAVPTQQGNGISASIHDISMPIVEGNGSALPGLLALKTLAAHGAILDCGSRKLIIPGPGGVRIEPSPGSLVIPLEKAPSGHLCMPVDAYSEVPKLHGGLTQPDAGLQLHTASDTSPPVESPNAAATTSAREGDNSEAASKHFDC